MLRMLLSFGLLLFLMPGVYSVAAAQNLQQRVESFAVIDWSQKVIRATGASGELADDQDRRVRVEALENAKARAAGNLLKAVQSLRIGVRGTILQLLKDNPQEASRLRNAVRQYTIVDTRSLSDMSVEVDVEIPISNGLTSLFLPDVTGQGKLRMDDIPRSPLGLLPWPECRIVPDGVELVVPSEGLLSYSGAAYTGLIVDATKLKVNPALFPRLVDEKGREVYGLNYVARDIVATESVTGYHTSLKAARRDKRIGREPFVVCGVRAVGDLNSDIVVSDNDAVLIHAAAKNSDFLKMCKVIFVVSE